TFSWPACYPDEMVGLRGEREEPAATPW
ncbi:hypothetical protein RRG08_043463, partial [Elysia crispata]